MKIKYIEFKYFTKFTIINLYITKFVLKFLANIEFHNNCKYLRIYFFNFTYTLHQNVFNSKPTWWNIFWRQFIFFIIYGSISLKRFNSSSKFVAQSIFKIKYKHDICNSQLCKRNIIFKSVFTISNEFLENRKLP